MNKHLTIYLTYRHAVHQQNALQAAPANLEVVIIANPRKEDILEVIPKAEFLISERSGQIDEQIINAGVNLKLIQRLGSQTFDIDLLAAHKKNIPVCYFPLPTSINVAEHIMMQILTLAKRTREIMHISQEAQDWGFQPVKCDANNFVINWSKFENILNISNSTVGIVGFGDIGTELTKRLKCFDCEILYFKRNRLPEFAENDLKIHYEELDRLLNKSDFVCSLLPFSSETEGSINKNFISKMKKGACLIHSGASGAVNESDIADALASGYLSGVAIDGFSWEPICSDNPLIPLARQPNKNIVLSPHTAVGSIDMSFRRRIAEYQNIVSILNGQPLKYQLI